jgi:hypothetical protein
MPRSGATEKAQDSGDCVFIERAGLEPLDPDADQIAR